MGQEIVQIQPPPIARCHACPLAKTSVLHYQESATQNVIIKPALDVYCIGGASPPRNCPNASFRSNDDYTGCVCRDGYFLDAAGGCADCPAGSYCVGGVRAPCPRHTYQTATRATACINCVATGDETGVYSDCPGNQQLEVCKEGKSTRLSDNCVPCTRCRKAYLTRTSQGAEPSQAEVDCYRSNA